MFNMTDFAKLKTPTDVILFQTNVAKSFLAYVPNEEVRSTLATLVEMNAALASAVCDAFVTYGTELKAKTVAA